MKKHTVRLTLNGVPREYTVAANELLLNVIREQEKLTGTKYGCGIGECGACTVHVNGKPTLSCLALAVSADGTDVVTIEGLAKGKELDPLQKSFLDNNAVQCGYCTPGMIMVGRNLLDENPNPTEEEVRTHMRGQLCRCTGYASIATAILGASQNASKGFKMPAE